ncbi:hypothetical protein AVEN_196842-1 [Araneus ventricosus]|uniref:Uncharacterized protein n=1 Tax=Araneus ventricosus TaxID=182803 RepID=A0A4Y2VRS6_ARAVE|nr:hypothetical protein AVEN_196842-1 [Araneus ventricosus]
MADLIDKTTCFPARATFFPYLLLPPIKSTCRSIWNEESGSVRGVRIRTGSLNPYGESESILGNQISRGSPSSNTSTNPRPSGESEYEKKNGCVPFSRTRVLLFILRIRIPKFVPE